MGSIASTPGTGVAPVGRWSQSVRVWWRSIEHDPAFARIRLPRYAGRGLRELFGGDLFGEVDEAGEYRITLGSQDFFWLRLRAARRDDGTHPQTTALPIITATKTS